MIDSLLRHRQRAVAPGRRRWRAQGVAARAASTAPQGYGVVTLHRPSNVDDAAALRGVARDPARSRAPIAAGLARASARAREHRALRAWRRCSRRSAITLLPPQGYLEMLGLMANARARAHRLRRHPGGDDGARACPASRCATTPSARSPSTRAPTRWSAAIAAARSACVDDDPRRRRQARPRAGTVGRPRRRAHRRGSRGLARHAPACGAEAVARMNAHDAADGAIVNALTIDVEDYFQVSAFAPHIPRATWDTLPCRVERNVDRILGMLADAGRTRDVLHAGLDRRTLSGADPPHRRRRARTREPRLRARARERAGLRRVPRRHPARQGRARGPDRDVGPGLSRAELLDRVRRTSGRSTASPRPGTATARASIRSGTITTACPTRRASRTRCAPACSRCRSRRCGCCAPTGRRAAAATSGCCPTGCRAGRCAA